MTEGVDRDGGSDEMAVQPPTGGGGIAGGRGTSSRGGGGAASSGGYGVDVPVSRDVQPAVRKPGWNEELGRE